MPWKVIAGRALLLFVFGLLLTCLMIYLGAMGDTRQRVSRDHSLALPEHVWSIRCSDFISTTMVMDSYAEASFLVERDELPELMAQIDSGSWRLSESDRSWKQPLKTPESFGEQEYAVYGKSREGNLCVILSYHLGEREGQDPDHDLVGVIVTTRWN